MPAVADLLAQLASPAAYPFPVDRIVVHQTHISMVFVAGEFVYKLKKPVALGFLDFSTLERRQHFCAEEVRLNSRLAPHVYLDVVPVVARDGQLVFEGAGDAVEYAVKMRRLPDEATLAWLLAADRVRREHLEQLAGKLAHFHQQAARGAPIAAFGRFAVVARNLRENFEQTAAHVDASVSRDVWTRVRALTERELRARETTIDGRAARQLVCDTHGDLRLEHVYHFPEQAPPQDWVIIDCIEFNERFRYADPVADVAFLAMDLAFQGRRDLAQQLADAYFHAAADEEGRDVLALYAAYRAVVRAKVEGIAFKEREIPGPERGASLQKAKAYWLLALGQLETAPRRPCLVLVAGLPGSGKSTLSRALAERAGFVVHRSDVVRKELARPAGAVDVYTPEWTERTYAELGRRAEATLWLGGRVLLDANFRRAAQRQAVLEAARRWAVPCLILECRVSAATARERLHARHGDASDADWQAYQMLAESWEEPGAAAARCWHVVDAEKPPAAMTDEASRVLSEAGLA